MNFYQQYRDNLTLFVLFDAKYLTRKALIFCLWRGIGSLPEIMWHMQPGPRDITVQDCDEETMDGLLHIYNKFRKQLLPTTLRQRTTLVIPVFEYLSQETGQVLIEQVSEWLLEADTRTIKGLLRVMEQARTTDLLEGILDTTVNYKYVKDIGPKCTKDLGELQDKTNALLGDLMENQA